MTVRHLATTTTALAAFCFFGCQPEDVAPVAPELGFVSINATEVESSKRQIGRASCRERV